MTFAIASLDPSATHTKFDYQKEAAKRILGQIKAFDLTTGSGNPSDEFAVNHVVSLFGARGTGKTTVLMDVKRQLENRIVEDRIVPTNLFVPDLLHDAEAIGPGVIKLVKDALLRGLEQDEDAAKQINDAFMRIEEDLAWFFNKSVPNDILVRDAISARHFATKTIEYYQSSLSLPKRFGEVVVECMDIRGFKRIVFLMDDADITLELTEKVLDFVRYFLSIPRIVTVICADGESLRRRLFNDRIDRLQSIDKLPEGSGFTLFGMGGDDFKKRELEAERDYVSAYLTKLLPPSTRVYLLPVDFSLIFNHKMGTAGNKSIADILAEIEFPSRLEGRRVSLKSLVELYPGVLATNLRELVNQFNLISEIEHAHSTSNEVFFGVSAGAEKLDFHSNPLEINTSDIPAIDEAAIIAVLRVFFSNSAHDVWREVWSYYGILDVMTEASLKKILNVAVTRIDAAGTSMNYFMFRMPAPQGHGALMSQKDEAHVFHVAIDLALHLGAKLSDVARMLGYVPSEAYNHLPVDASVETVLRTDDAQALLRNTSLAASSKTSNIVATFSTEGNLARTQPVHLHSSSDLALHFHYTVNSNNHQEISDDNQNYLVAFEKDELKPETLLSLDKERIFAILYRVMDSTIDQLRAAFHATSDDKDVSGSGSVALGFSSNLSLSWRIWSPIDGWSFLAKLFSDIQNGGEGFEKTFQTLMHLAQHAYPVMFSVFPSESKEPGAKGAVFDGFQAFRALLEERGFTDGDGEFVSHTRYCEVIESDPTRYRRLKKSQALWPEVDMKARGDSLIELLDFIDNGPETLGEDDLRSDPPPSWKRIVDMLVVEDEASTSTASK